MSMLLLSGAIRVTSGKVVETSGVVGRDSNAWLVIERAVSPTFMISWVEFGDY